MLLVAASCCQPGHWGAKMPLSRQEDGCYSAPAAVLHITLRSLAGGTDTQQAFGGPSPHSFFEHPRRVLSQLLTSASYCVTPLQHSFLSLPFPSCSSCNCWRAERQECASKPCVLSYFPWGRLSKQADVSLHPSSS